VAWLLAHGDDEVRDAAVAGRYLQLVERRRDGVPVAYLRGEKEFWGRSFHVDPRVLVPRPETEHLVESTLSLHLSPDPLVLDLGTGSGCLAVTLALELPGARVVAVDRDLAALTVARGNVERHRVADRVHLVAGEWAAALDLRSCDLVVTNPPYVDPADAASYEADVARHEPAAALFAGAGGLDAYRRLFRDLRGLGLGVPFLTEIGRRQLAPLEDLATASGWRLVDHRADLAGIPRVAVWRRSP
jgi:release factor glutamine methyltransferase